MAYDFINDVFNTPGNVNHVPSNTNVPYAGMTPGMVANPYPGHPYGSSALPFNNWLPGVRGNNEFNAQHGKPLIGGEWPIGGTLPGGNLPGPTPTPTPEPTPEPTPPLPPACPPGYVWDANTNACVPLPDTSNPPPEQAVTSPYYLYEQASDIASESTGGGAIPVGAQFVGNDGKIHTVGYTEGTVDPALAAAALRAGDGGIHPDYYARKKKKADIAASFAKGIPIIGGLIAKGIQEGVDTRPRSDAQAFLDSKPGGKNSIYNADGTLKGSTSTSSTTSTSPSIPATSANTVTVKSEKGTGAGKSGYGEGHKFNYGSDDADRAAATQHSIGTSSGISGGGLHDNDLVGDEDENTGGWAGDGYNMGGAVMPLASILTQGMNLGGKVKKIYNEGYTAPGQAYAIAKSMGYNQGGMTTQQAMSHHPYNREGGQFDTVRANLTPGEFVVDADSSHAIEQVAPGMLDALNSWEPHQGKDKLVNDVFNTLDDVTITKKRKDGNTVTIKSAEGSRLADMFGGN